MYHERPVRDFAQPWGTTTFSSCGTYPSAAGHYLDIDIQGITHDENNWFSTNAIQEWSAQQCEIDLFTWGPFGYFSCQDDDIQKWNVSYIWKHPVSSDIAVSPALVKPNPWQGLRNHFGAITYVNGRVYVPIQPGGGAQSTGAVGVSDAATLETIGLADNAGGTKSSWTDECTPDFSWIAYNPVDGLFYAPAGRDSGCMVVWQMVPQGTAGLLVPIRSVLFRTALNGNRAFFDQQGGAFSPTGRLYVIGNSSINIVDPLSGVVLYTLSFNAPADEGEGITVWDLSQVANKGPGVNGHLHFQRLVNHPSQDDYYLDHWCANDVSKL